MAEAAAPAVSSAAQAILGVAGLSALLLVLWIASMVARAVLALLSSGQKSAAKPAAAKKEAAAGKQANAPASSAAAVKAAAAAAKRGPDLKTLIAESRKAERVANAKEDMAAHHPLFLTTLKGHGDAINAVAWSPDGRMLASACDDLTLRVFDLADPTNRDPKFRFVRAQRPVMGCGFGNAAGDVIGILRDIPDQARVVLYTPTKAKGGGAVQFDQKWEAPNILDREPLLDCAVVPAPQSSTGGGVAVALSAKKQGRVVDLSTGRAVALFEPNSLGNHALAVSPCGKFFAVASFTADVKVWEVEWGRDGFKAVTRAMDLKGHSRKVMSVAISPDGARAATASEDGTLRVWRLDVRYRLAEDPKVALTAPLAQLGLAEGQVFTRMAWGPDGTIAAAYGTHVSFIDAATGRLLERVHAHDVDVRCMAWTPGPVDVGGGQRAAALATCSSDRRVRVWRSPNA